ncbi:MAG: hypothetical protein M1478_04555 [Deltaproteobacteria bacterium]|jgi:hypothetical protein|nr:hypothetical protein [Deltaproteobacteria bacterium]MCL5880086.1 hypothetical protein [Deltaproteobacteria bacterium]
MKIKKEDIDKVLKISDFFEEFKFKYDDDGIFDLSKSIESEIDRLLVLFEEINKKKEIK